MDRALQRLERVLELEKQQGYQNKAVVGGIRQFAVFWVTQANEEASDEADRALAEQVSEVLMEYGRLSGVEARARAIDSLLASMERRRSRRPEAPPAPPPAPPPARSVPPPKATAPAEASPRPAPAAVAPPVDEEPAEEEAVAPDAAIEPERPFVTADPLGLTQPVTALKGVGQKIAERLNRIGPQTIWELLYLFPRRYDDYTLMKPISKLKYGEQVTVIGTIWQTRTRKTRINQSLVECIVNDGTGTVQATWFNQPWLADQLPAGLQIVLSGKVELFLGRLVFNSPEWEPLELEPLRTRRIVPVYPLTEGLLASKMREIMQRTVREWAERAVAPRIRELDREHRFDASILAQMADLGLLGVSVPSSYGGTGTDYISLGVASEELEYVDTSLRVILSVHVGLNSLTLLAWGTEAQKQRYLVPQAQGKKIATFGLTEPSAG
ncbi:MAG TPA: acyl-CoA dehydrogenase family protein, partial [Promineifilum sp.]|nr:acyl-CoA dehydrogenase family protein [Promineifilum sp.]